MLDKLIFLVSLAATAVVFADVLVRPGMLLEPVQRRLREWHREQWAGKMAKELAKELSSIYATRKPQEFYQRFFDDYYGTEWAYLDNKWWWPPLWGCYKCVAGQWGFWGYLARYYPGYTWRTVPEHLAFTAFTIIAAIILHKWTQE